MEPETQAVPGYFVWQVPGQPVAVHLSIDVVDRMGADILRGFGLVPKRGAEVGGILIGTVTRASQPAASARSASRISRQFLAPMRAGLPIF